MEIDSVNAVLLSIRVIRGDLLQITCPLYPIKIWGACVNKGYYKRSATYSISIISLKVEQALGWVQFE